MLTDNDIQILREASATQGGSLAGNPVRRRFTGHRAKRAVSRGGLSPRELQVLELLCKGFSNKLICRTLDIAEGTVKIHVGRVLRQLQAATRLQAVVEAHRRGLVAGG